MEFAVHLYFHELGVPLGLYLFLQLVKTAVLFVFFYYSALNLNEWTIVSKNGKNIGPLATTFAG